MTPIPRRAGLFLAFLMLLSPFAMRAEVPALLNHQGVLTDSNGVVLLDGDYLIRFGIWDSPSLGNELFFQEITVSVVGGMYNVLLSEVGLFDVFDGPQRFLEIEIVDDPHDVHDNTTLTPRQQFASVPYAAVAETVTTMPEPAAQGLGAANLVRNGSFEDRADASNTTPAAWSDVGSPSFSHDDTDSSEGAGHEIRISSNNDGTDDGIRQTLNGLKASTTYAVVARVKADPAATCHVRIDTGGGTNLDASSDSTTYASITGTFVTDSFVNAPALELTVDDTAAVACSFDHIGVFEKSPDDVPTPGGLVQQANYTGTAAVPTTFAGAPNPFATVEVTVPGPGMAIRVTANLCAQQNGGAGFLTQNLQGEITEEVDGGGSPLQVRSTGMTSHEGGAEVSISMIYLQTDPTPGNTYTYALNIQGSSYTMNAHLCTPNATALVAELLRMN